METCSVKLISLTKPSGDLEHLSAEELIAYTARVSNPANQMNQETAPRLLAYCIRNKHWSIFEQVNMTVEIETSRGIAAQILRHRSFSFQEFCIAGDSEISFDSPYALKMGKRGHYTLTIAELWDKWHNGARSIPHRVTKAPIRMPMKNRLRNMNIRTLNQETNSFTTSKLLNVYQTGIKPIFEVTLHNGKQLK